MKDQRVKILEMYKEGKLSKEQALELLEALDDYDFVMEDEDFRDESTGQGQDQAFNYGQEGKGFLRKMRRVKALGSIYLRLGYLR